jgi:hypothetical protein
MYYKNDTEEVFLFKELSFIPDVPKKFVNEAMDIALDENNAVPQTGELYKELSPKIWFREIKDLDGKVVKGRPNIKFKMSDEFDVWITKHVCEVHDGSYINVAYQNKEGDGATAPIHTDLSRDYVLIYILEMSNPDQYTKFWRERDMPIERNRGTFLNEWDNCEFLGEACFKPHTWYLMKATVLHSIHNIQGDRRGRLSIQVKVDNPFTPGFFINNIM